MPVDLLVGGDIVPTRTPTANGFASVVGAMRDADITFVNLETPLSRRGSAADKLIRFRTDPSVAALVASWGVDVVTLANNHALDYGTDALLDTMDCLEQAGVAHVGAGLNIESALAPTVLERANLRFAFMGVASTLPNGSSAGPERAGVGPVRVFSRFLVDTVTIDEDPGMSPWVETVSMLEDVERLERKVSEAKQVTDVVIVACHWGVPPALLPTCQGPLADYQRPLAHRLIDAGADAVLGHHPHTLHGIEWYKERPIFYSLGNLLFHTLQGDMAPSRSQPRYRLFELHGELAHLGGLASLSWEVPGPPTRVELLPVLLDENGDPAFGRSEQLTASLEHLGDHCAELGTSIDWQDDRSGRATVRIRPTGNPTP